VTRDLIRTTAFVRAVKRYIKKHPTAQAALEQALYLLSEDAFNPQLKTHKLSGELNGVWACSAGYDLRILFEFVDAEGKEAILLLTVGSHDDVY
jgi:addiction module RelE/StbE family toxin